MDPEINLIIRGREKELVELEKRQSFRQREQQANQLPWWSSVGIANILCCVFV